MHELSVCQSIIQQALQLADEHQAERGQQSEAHHQGEDVAKRDRKLAQCDRLREDLGTRDQPRPTDCSRCLPPAITTPTAS